MILAIPMYGRSTAAPQLGNISTSPRTLFSHFTEVSQ
jgi:hypothetical protein